MRKSWNGRLLVWGVAVACVVTALLNVPRAQDVDDPAALKAQIAQKDQQIAALQQQKAAPGASLAQAKAYYAGTFKANKEQAQEACRAAGGHLWVMVTATATRPTVSVSCEF